MWYYKQKGIEKFSPLLQVFSFTRAIEKAIKREGRDITQNVKRSCCLDE